MSLKEDLAQWWNEKKMQMLVGMEMQLAKYPEGDPRHNAVQKKIDNFKEGVDIAEGDEDGSECA